MLRTGLSLHTGNDEETDEEMEAEEGDKAAQKKRKVGSQLAMQEPSGRLLDGV